MADIELATREHMQGLLVLGAVAHANSQFRDWPLSMENMAEFLASFVTNPFRFGYVAVDHAQAVVGYILAEVHDCHFADVVVCKEHGFFVHPDHRSLKVAANLLMALEAEAERRGAKVVQFGLTFSYDPRPVMNFLGRRGYAQLGLFAQKEI